MPVKSWTAYRTRDPEAKGR